MPLHARQPYDLEIAAQIYDELMADYWADVAVYVKLAEEFGGPVLELACGTGRCLIPLIRQGFDVVGIDSSEPMLRRLREKLDAEPDEVRYRASYIQADNRFYTLPIHFGMAFIAVNSFGHLLTKADQEAFATNVFEHLRPGGILAIDIFNPDLSRLLANTESSERRVGNIRVIERVTATDLAEQTRHIVTTYYQEEGQCIAEAKWSLRYVFRYELECLLERAGFDVIRLWGDYEQHSFGEATKRLFIVAQKPGREESTAVKQAEAIVTELV
jgi:SAM-dependent methyltransferase